MVALYVTSVDGAGKTALCAGIGKKSLSQGRKVGFMVPVQVSDCGKSDDCKDIGSIKEIFGLKESTEQLCPNPLSRGDLRKNLTDGLADFTQKLKQDYTKVSQGKEIIIMEGLSGFGVDDMATRASYAIADALDAKVIVLMRYSPTTDRDAVVKAGKKLGERLLGVVINFVPGPKMAMAKESAKALFEKVGIRVLGVIPEVRSLFDVSVKELAEFLGGEILTAKERIDEVVENIMLGAMAPESGIYYFSRKANKAAVIRSERADMQLAALETSTKCLILTGGSKPLPAVVNQAEDKHVPIVVVKDDVSKVITGIEEILAEASFNKPQKLQKFENIISQYVDFKALYSQLGLQA
jgi:BioD-like phosphotransacetylase family protein